jgi:hypothetical protein
MDIPDDIFHEIVQRVPRIYPLVIVCKSFHRRLHAHPEIKFWREYISPDDIFARGAPKMLAGVDADWARGLDTASYAGNLPMVRFLVQRIAGSTPARTMQDSLYSAVVRGHNEIIRLLIAAGADVSYDDDEAVQTAAGNDHVDTVKLLIELGADWRNCDDLALRWARQRGATNVVEYLSALAR